MGYLWPAITRVWRAGAGYCRYGSYRLPAYVVGMAGACGESRGLSNNGAASGDSELKTAGLPPLAVRISKGVSGHQDLPAGGHEDGNGGYHRK